MVFEVHMMVSNPDQWIGDMSSAGADIYTFHLEASQDPKETIEKIKSSGMMVCYSLFLFYIGKSSFCFITHSNKKCESFTKILQAGCGIKPKTPVGPLSELADNLDVMLIMTVEPGFGGQSFMTDMMSKVCFSVEIIWIGLCSALLIYNFHC